MQKNAIEYQDIAPSIICGISLQVVEPDVPSQDRTYHILARYLSFGKRNPVKPSSIRLKHLPKFLERNEDWCRSVTSTFRARKKKSWEQFKEELFYEPFALTLPGIVIWARCYHLHVAVFFNYGYWTTHHKHDLKQCHVFLLFRGNNVYDDTRMITSPEYKERQKEISRTARKIDRYLNRRREQLRKQAEEESSSSNNTNESLNNTDIEKSDSKRNGEQSDVDLEEMLEKTVDNIDNVQKVATQTEEMRNVETNNNKASYTAVDSTEPESDNTKDSEVPETVDNTEPESDNKRETDLNNVQNQKEVPESIDITETDSDNKTDTNIEKDNKTDDMPRTQIVTCNSAKLQKTQEEDDMQLDEPQRTDNVHNVQKEKDVKPRQPISTHSSGRKAASKLLHKAKIKIKGSWEFVNNEIAERAKRTKCYLCGSQKGTLRALESHIRKRHKSYRYKCKYCPKKYLTRAGRNKHEMYHTIGYRFKCKDCTKRFMFESQYEEHRSVHTRENRFICRKKGCDKHYGSTRARNYHERQHNAKAMYCDYRETPKSKKCNQQFFSKQHYQQHYQGLHGDGFNAKCGKNFAWPAQRTAHEKECTACGKIKKKEKARKLSKGK